MGIPTNVTIWLMINTIAFAVTDAFFQTVAGTGFAFLGRCIHRSTISSQSQFFEREQILINRSLEEKGIENFPKPQAGCHIRRWIIFKLLKQIFESDFFNRSSFLFFALWLLRFFLVDGWHQRGFYYQTAKDVCESHRKYQRREYHRP